MSERETETEKHIFCLPVDTSRPVNQVAEFSALVFGLKEKCSISVCEALFVISTTEDNSRPRSQRGFNF